MSSAMARPLPLSPRVTNRGRSRRTAMGKERVWSRPLTQQFYRQPATPESVKHVKRGRRRGGENAAPAVAGVKRHKVLRGRSASRSTERQGARPAGTVPVAEAAATKSQQRHRTKTKKKATGGHGAVQRAQTMLAIKQACSDATAIARQRRSRPAPRRRAPPSPATPGRTAVRRTVAPGSGSTCATLTPASAAGSVVLTPGSVSDVRGADAHLKRMMRRHNNSRQHSNTPASRERHIRSPPASRERHIRSPSASRERHNRSPASSRRQRQRTPAGVRRTRRTPPVASSRKRLFGESASDTSRRAREPNTQRANTTAAAVSDVVVGLAPTTSSVADTGSVLSPPASGESGAQHPHDHQSPRAETATQKGASWPASDTPPRVAVTPCVTQGVTLSPRSRRRSWMTASKRKAAGAVRQAVVPTPGSRRQAVAGEPVYAPPSLCSQQVVGFEAAVHPDHGRLVPQITEAVTGGSFFSRHTAYRVTLTPQDAFSGVMRRYSEFRHLYNTLRARYAHAPTEFPRRTFWSLRRRVVDKRKVDLQSFLRAVFGDIALSSCAETREFVGMP